MVFRHFKNFHTAKHEHVVPWLIRKKGKIYTICDKRLSKKFHMFYDV
jgi:hypothetical protein